MCCIAVSLVAVVAREIIVQMYSLRCMRRTRTHPRPYFLHIWCPLMHCMEEEWYIYKMKVFNRPVNFEV